MGSNRERRRWAGLVGASQRVGVGRAREAVRLRLRPAVLALEDRRLLATFTVTSTADTMTDGLPDRGTLRWAVAQADAADESSTIAFDLGTAPATIALRNGQLELSGTGGPIAIIGPGAETLAIDGGGKDRVLQVDPNVTATITGLTIRGGSTGGDGGGLANAGSTTLAGVAVIGNTSSAWPLPPGISLGFPAPAPFAVGGGGLYNAPTGQLTLQDCSVSGNSARFVGGGLFSLGRAFVVGSTFQGNTAGWAGGGLEQGITGSPADLVVADSSFEDNQAQNAAGLLQSAGTATLVDSTFEGNQANGGGGGLWFFGTAKLTACTISGNSALGFVGGGLGNSGTATLEGCTISDNYGYASGGIENRGTITIQRSTISGNRTYDGFISGGGGLTTFGPATLVDTVISGNSAAFGGGIANAPGGATSLVACDLSGNTAFSYGGGFLNDGGQASISGCRIAGNTASSAGGGIEVLDGAVSIRQSLVASNSAGTEGGGLFVFSGPSYGDSPYLGVLTADDVIVASNSAAIGGGISNAGNLTATRVLVLNNAATDGGGIANAGTLTMSSSEVIGDTATHDGGGLLNHGTATLSADHLSANSAGVDGGGVLDDGMADLIDCTISGNTAASGGGLYVAAGGTVQLKRTKVQGNHVGDIAGQGSVT